MLTPDQIDTAITNAQYALALGVTKDFTLMHGACQPKSWNTNLCFNAIIKGLKYQSNREDYGSVLTYSLYKKALGLTGFVGSLPNIDPNFQQTNITIIVQNPVADIPWMDIPWSVFSTDGSVDGGRNTYYDTTLAGVNPALQLATSLLLQLGIDYDLIPTGGFILRADGGLPFIYDGQFLRAESFKYLGNIPVPSGTRIPEIFIDASDTSLTETYLNTTYPNPTYIEGDIVIVPAVFLQYQRQSNNNPSVWSEVPYAQAES